MRKVILLPVVVAVLAFAAFGVGSAAAQPELPMCIHYVTVPNPDPCVSLTDPVGTGELVCIEGTTYYYFTSEESFQAFLDQNELNGYTGPCITSAGTSTSASPPRAGYCAVDGNTTDTGTPIPPGTFLNLTLGQPSTDSNFTGATPAFYVDGTGLTCDPPSGVYSLAVGELVDALGEPNPPGIMLPGNIYPHYVQS